ncbi:MAG: ankyrin repeat domain-containing protein [Planctomycetota bacterium]
MKLSLPLKLGIFVVLLFSAIIAACLLWAPIHVRYYRGKLQSPETEAEERVRGVTGLLRFGRKGLVVLAEELDGGEDAARLLAENWKNVNKPAKNGYLGRAALHVAAEKGYLKAARLLIYNGASPDGRMHFERTPLHVAAEYNQRGIAALLIEHGADIEAKDHEGMTPLYYTGRKDCRETAELLVEKGARLDVKGRYLLSSPLHEICKWGSEETAIYLIGKGADVNAKNKSRMTPLHYAANHGKTGLVRFLIENGANIRAKDRRGQTPLCETAWPGIIGFIFFEESQMTPEQLAKHKEYIEELKRDKLETARLLVELGADAGSTDIHNSTILHTAAGSGFAEMAAFLIEKGADVNAKDTCNETPLHNAVEEGEKDIVLLLINSGADVNVEGNNYGTPLCKAVLDSRLEIAKLLVENGANVNAGRQGRTLLHCAVQRADIKIIKLLLANGAEVNGTQYSSEKPYGMTPLDIALADYDREIVMLLRKYGGKTGMELEIESKSK